MSACTAPGCESESEARCDNCGKWRCADHIELDPDTRERFCDFACGGGGIACTRCRVRRRNVDGLCWQCYGAQRQGETR